MTQTQRDDPLQTLASDTHRTVDGDADGDDAAESVLSLERGTSVGRYVTLEQLGAGAMGVVHAAYDPELDRKVAIKLLRPRGARAEAARLRLQREAQAMAKLSHPNVVSVFDVGEFRTSVFVAMEFLEGPTLSAWLAASPGWQAVLRVFEEAGRGLAAAHDAGLVHRDFKPDNVVLDGRGHARVTDFGLARGHRIDAEDPASPPLHDDIDTETTPRLDAFGDDLTLTGAMLGTPAYMAPEQMFGREADVRSDQFSFCVAFFEGLYGSRPYSGRTLPELAMALTQGTLKLPESRRGAPMWLHKIVLRGLSIEPEKRWGSMAELLAALDRGRRARGRLGVALGGVAVATLAIGSTALRERAPAPCSNLPDTVGALWNDSVREDLGRGFEETGIPFAPGTWQRVRTHVDEYAAAWEEARRGNCLATRASGGQSESLMDLRMSCYDDRIRELEAVLDRFEQPDADVIKSAVRTVAELPALEPCSDADTLRMLTPPPSDPETNQAVQEARMQLAAARATGASGRAKEAAEQAAEVLERANAIGYSPLISEAERDLGKLQYNSRQFEEAQATMTKAHLSALRLRDSSLAADTALELMKVAARRAKFDTSDHWGQQAGAHVTAVDDDRLAEALRYAWGSLEIDRGNFDEASKRLNAAMDALREAGREETLHAAAVMGLLARLAEERSDFDAARDWGERSIAIKSAKLGPDHPEVGESMDNLGTTFGRAGRLDLAKGYFERSLQLYEAALGPEDPAVGATMNNLGMVAHMEGRLDEARVLFERSLAIDERTYGSEHPNVGMSLANIAIVAREQGDRTGAREGLSRALEIFEAAYGADHPNTAQCVADLADFTYADGDVEKALAMYERAAASFEASTKGEHPQYPAVLARIGHCRATLGNNDGVERLEKALKMQLERSLDPIQIAETELWLAQGLVRRDGRRAHERARALAESALAREAPPNVHDRIRKWLAEL